MSGTNAGQRKISFFFLETRVDGGVSKEESAVTALFQISSKAFRKGGLTGVYQILARQKCGD